MGTQDSMDRPAGLQLILRVFCEGDADGVTQAIHEEGADADGGLQPAILALSSLCSVNWQV